jgi:multiple sugar transport system substrate-binding protein
VARTLTALAAVVAVVALVVAGLGRGSGDSGPGGAIDFQVAGDAEELRVYRELAAAYRRRTGERVRLIEVGDRQAQLAKLATAFGAGRPPDVVLLNHRYVGGYIDRGVLDPVGPRLDASDALSPDDFYDVPRAAFTRRGTLTCLPQNVSSLVVYYNRDMFRAAGVPLPARNWTYEQFLSAARRLTRGEVHGVGVEPSVIRSAPFVWGAGGELVDDDERPTRFLYDSPRSRRGLDALIATRPFAPTANEAASRPLEERFIAGQLGMLLSSRVEVPTLRTIDDFTWDVAAFPLIERPATVLHTDGFCLPREGDPERAWRFVEFAAGVEGQSILARAGRTVPANRAAARSPAFLDPRRPPRSNQVFLDAIASMRRLPTTPNWEAAEESANRALERAYYGTLSVDAALRRISSETDGGF